MSGALPGTPRETWLSMTRPWGPELQQVAPGERAKGAALTLVEDVHARLVGTDDLQGFGVRGEDPDYAPVIRHQPLGRLLLRDAFWHYQSVLDFKFGGPVEGGVINLCRDRETCLESWAAHPAGGEWALGPEPGSPGH